MKERRRYAYMADVMAIKKKMSGRIPQKLIVMYTTPDGSEHSGTVEECLAAGGIFQRVISGNTVDDIIHMLDVTEPTPATEQISGEKRNAGNIIFP